MVGEIVFEELEAGHLFSWVGRGRKNELWDGGGGGRGRVGEVTCALLCLHPAESHEEGLAKSSFEIEPAADWV